MINQNSQFTTSNTDLQKSEKNVLIFCVDQMRADFLGAAGRLPIRTPNLDRLVEEGMLFTRSYCTNPICMPARASMFTGLLPRDHGVKINGHYLNPSIPTLPGILKDSGYYCHAAGKLHLTPWISKSAPENRNMYPEDLNFWTKGLHNEFPNNYYGFSATDFVVGHTSYAHGEYMQWLLDKNGDPVLLKEEKALFTAANKYTKRKEDV